mmetsp:Transcript_14829/g.28197  ORF Transcript_14829/g.28197 Transcript_14829/m.28197 type:complete len:91 (+) Transcript_14829:334-606(+)
MSQVRIHERSHTGEKPFWCRTCGLKMSIKGNLDKHERTHLNDSGSFFRCSKCDYRSYQAHNVLRHERLVHHKKKTRRRKKARNASTPSLQ